MNDTITADGGSKHRPQIQIFFLCVWCRTDPRTTASDAAVVPGWSMESLQNPIWCFRHQLSNICLQRHDSDASEHGHADIPEIKIPLQRKRGLLARSLVFQHHQRPSRIHYQTSLINIASLIIHLYRCVLRTLEFTQTPGNGWGVCFFELEAENDLNHNLHWVLQNVLIYHLITGRVNSRLSSITDSSN